MKDYDPFGVALAIAFLLAGFVLIQMGAWWTVLGVIPTVIGLCGLVVELWKPPGPPRT